MSSNWLMGGTHPAIDIAFQHIGSSWSVEKREEILNTISHAIFPPNHRADAWGGYNQTIFANDGQFYYPITVPLGTYPNAWFKNLRILQIRVKLKLISSLRVSLLSQPSCISREVLAKLNALKDAIGKEIIENHKIPKMKKHIMRTNRNIANIAAESSRARGLAARERRN